MEIEWINNQFKESNYIFDSWLEAEEWADSLYSDFAGIGFINTGYATPDEKVYTCLLENIQLWVRYNSLQVVINTETTCANGVNVYKVWFTVKAE